MIGDYVSDTSAYDARIAIDSKNNIYILFTDQASGKPTVKKFENGIWIVVGTEGFVDHSVFTTDFEIDKKDSLYIGFIDPSLSYRGFIYKFKGSWEKLDSVDIPGAKHDGMCFVVDSNGFPVVFANAPDLSGVKVFKYDGSGWNEVGNLHLLTYYKSEAFDIALDSLERPVVLFRDKSIGGRPTAMIYSNSNWSVLKSGIVGQEVTDGRIVISKSGEVIIAVKEYYYSSRITVMRLKDWNWSMLGIRGVLRQGAYGASFSLIVNQKGHPILASGDIGNNGKATVIEYTDSTWEGKGVLGLSFEVASDNTIRIGKNNKPYLFFTEYDYPLNPRPRLLEYKDGSWNRIDLGIIDSVSANYADMEIDSTGKIYMAWYSKYGLYSENGFTVVSYFNGVIDTIGEPGFSSNHVFNDHFDLSLDHNGVPYIVYGSTRVKKFDGTSWVAVGSEVFGSADVDVQSLTFDSLNSPVIAFIDNNLIGDPLTILKFDGNDWIYLGDSLGISGAFRSEVNISANRNGQLYVGYNYALWDNGGFVYTMGVKTYDGGTWVFVGDSSISTGSVVDSKLLFDRNNSLYIIYSDLDLNGRMVVKKYVDSIWLDIGNGPLSTSNTKHCTADFDSDGKMYLSGSQFTAFAYKSTSAIKEQIDVNENQFSIDNGYENYQWYYNGIALQNDTIYTLEVTQNGLYHCTFNNGGCTGTSNTVQYILTSIEEPLNKFTGFPNPVINFYQLSERTSWELYDTNGRLLKTGESNNIDFRLYTKSYYFLKVRNETLKIIKM